MNRVHFGQKNSAAETPMSVFKPLDDEFHFQIDVCALPETAKCKKYFTPEQDGLSQKWEGVCWCNPPYGRQIGEWVSKAATSEALTVMLLPARTDTAWFHDFCLKHGEIRFLRGRIRFVGAKNNAPFPSMIVIFDGRHHEQR